MLTESAPPADWNARDAVYTPVELARFLVGLLPWEGIDRVLEPSAGGGAWIEAMRPLDVPYQLMVDIDGHCPAARLEGEEHWVDRRPKQRLFIRGDVLTLKLGKFHRAIGNPPYSAIMRHVDRCLELADEVAFLLPVGITEGATGRWLRSTPLRHWWSLEERPFPKHVRGCGFFWWDRSHVGPVVWESVSWRGKPDAC